MRSMKKFETRYTPSFLPMGRVDVTAITQSVESVELSTLNSRSAKFRSAILFSHHTARPGQN